ncbi:MAG: helix-turn-helix domain-containing protein [Sulfuritalea sp.]|jgi:AcrR family transcriptional regulator|nr:helix-turn-helix domain-containing protein [Sulfuritalea sp.]MDP1981334.1 helix-turn-helix domain-containing protein [Sulfuritalea sp.]
MTTPAATAEPEAPVDRKSAILASALAVFSEKGIEATTIEDIRARSQASVGSIYHHFGTKEGIAAALFAQGIDDYWLRLLTSAGNQPSAERTIHGLIEAHIHWITARPDLARFLFSRRQAVGAAFEQAIRVRTAGHFKAVFALLKPWFKQGVLRRLPAELYVPLLMGPAQEYSRQWLSGRIELDPLIAIEELSVAAWRSLAVAKE